VQADGRKELGYAASPGGSPGAELCIGGETDHGCNTGIF
jgi:hypothetical protein